MLTNLLILILIIIVKVKSIQTIAFTVFLSPSTIIITLSRILNKLICNILNMLDEIIDEFCIELFQLIGWDVLCEEHMFLSIWLQVAFRLDW